MKLTRIWIPAVLAWTAVAHGETGYEPPESYDTYRKEIGAAEQQLDYSKRLLRHDKLHTLIPESKTETEASPSVPTEDNEGPDKEDPDQSGPGGSDGDDVASQDDEKEAGPGAGSRGEPSNKPEGEGSAVAAGEQSEEEGGAPSSGEPEAKPPVASQGTRYISPSLRTGSAARGRSNNALITRPDSDPVTFGIPIGTRISVRLDESATNVQPGLIVLTVEETIRGRKEVLPRGSRLFARSAAVIGHDNLYLNVSRGITPDEQEFRVQGTVFSDNREPGLAGRVLSDGKTLARATSQGMNTLGQRLLDNAPLAGVGGAAAEAGIEQVLREKQRKDDAQQGRPAYVVQAHPQKGFVQIESTF